MGQLDGKKAVVTGASRGIGQAIAVGLANEGADVMCVARSEDALKQTARMVEETGRFAAWTCVDLSEEGAQERIVAETKSSMGGLDILVNNAAADHDSSVLDTGLETWDHVMSVNLRSPFLLCRAAGGHFLGQGSGKVINITSILSQVAVRDNSAYIAAKSGLLGFTRALALEWAREGIQVNALAPGFIKTEMTAGLWETERGTDWVVKRTPVARWGGVQDLVGAAVFLSSPASDFVTGQQIIVDGGWTAQ